MQIAARSYMAAGVALIGASAIAVSPMAPPTPQVHLPVALTAAVENPLTVFQPVATAAETLISNIIERQTTNPAPILRQLAANAAAGAQVVATTDPVWVAAYALADVVVRVQALGVSNLEALADTTTANGTAISDALSGLGAGLPDALAAAGDLVAEGKINEAIDSVVLAGQGQLINILLAVNSEIDAVGTVLSIPKPLTDATGNAVIGVVLGIAASTIGIGYHLPGPQPLVQQFITSAQTVAAGAASGDPGTFVNALQHGIADFAEDVISQTDTNIGMANSIVDGYVNALKQITPKPITQEPLPTAKALAAPAPAAIAAKTEAAPVTNVDNVSDTEAGAAPDAPEADADKAADDPAKASTATKVSVSAHAKASNPAKAIGDQVKSAVKKMTDGLKKDNTATGKTRTEKKAASAKGSKGRDAKGGDKH